MSAAARFVFLDIDGVLNSTATRPHNPQGLGDWIDERNLAVLNELVVRTDAGVVVSSSWRRGRTSDDLNRTLARSGFVGQVFDVTPELRGRPRWEEIRAWLGPRQGDEFVVLDDEADMGELAPFHVRTSPLRGLTREDLPAAIRYLGGEVTTPVHFFHPARRPFGVLSNFSPHAITVDGRAWPTAEHYYQAQKFAPGPARDTIATAASPHAAKVLARGQTVMRIPDWDQVKEEVMRATLAAKFGAHTVPRTVLLATGKRLIAEASPHDPYWGLGPDAQGRNRLGHLLMELRGALFSVTTKGDPLARSANAHAGQ